MSQLVLLDNEAVQALADPTHPKHRRVVSHTQVVANRKRRATEIRLAVPAAVRVEAGWDRTAPSWSFANHLRITDMSLDAASANVAAAIRDDTGVSVPDAHLGAVIQSLPADHITVLTSDPEDMRIVAGDAAVTIVTI
ncbi:MAG: hypothetical protein ACYDGY_03605 [Acidimicrobiales bacterium]